MIFSDFFSKNPVPCFYTSCKLYSLYTFSLVILGVIALFSAQSIHAQDTEAPNYQWKSQYYGKVNGVQKLLHTRSFSMSHLSFIDVDGDGDEDLFVGKADGRVAFFRNIGTRALSNFVLESEDFPVLHQEIGPNNQLLQVQKPIDVGNDASPTFVDINGDGDLDLFVGSGDGSLFYYENRGNSRLPVFVLADPDYMKLNLGANIAPIFADINSDRKPDLLVGTREGKTWLFFNTGTTSKALFCPLIRNNQIPDPMCPERPVLVGDIAPLVNAVPTFVDWEKDGDQDIVVGKSNGRLDFYLNRGDAFAPKWSLESDRFLFLDAGGFAAPTFYDLNNDSFPELFLGNYTSQVIYYSNHEVLFSALRQIQGLDLSLLNQNDPPALLLQKACAQLMGIDLQTQAIPNNPLCLNQLNQAFNMFKARTQGQTVLTTDPAIKNLTDLEARLVRPEWSFRSAPVSDNGTTPQGGAPAAPGVSPAPSSGVNQANPPVAAAGAPTPGANVGAVGAGAANGVPPDNATAAPSINRNDFWLVSRNFLNFERLLPADRYTVITSGDWNGDGKTDLILGGRSGRLHAYENRGTKQLPDWFAIPTPTLVSAQRRFAAPTLVDLDGDGDLDLLVGNQQGQIELFRNQGTSTVPKWGIESVYLDQIDVGSYSLPITNDIDKDGDPDLFVGNARGFVIFYENQTANGVTKFVLTSTQFANVGVSRNAAPAFLDVGAGQPVFSVGSGSGGLGLTVHSAQDKSPMQGWRLSKTQWDGIITSGFSTPHFRDLNGDQQIDLLMGDEQGNLLLWLNQGVQQPVVIDEQQTSLSSENTLEKQKALVNSAPAKEITVGEIPAPEKVIIDRPFDPVYVLVDQNYTGLAMGRRTVPAFIDMDGDGDPDMLVGNKAGELRYYNNEGEGEPQQWRLVEKQFLNYDGGKNAAPVFADVNGDGLLDLLVGNETGDVQYWENRGAPGSPEFVRNTTTFSGVTGGRNSVPAIVASQKNGEMELLVGNFRGQLVQYLRSTGEKSFFKLNHRRYLSLDVGLGSVPVVADLNNDQQSDLVVSSDHGMFYHFQPAQRTSRWGWSPRQGYFNNLNLPVGSFPAFVDLDMNRTLDMVVGSEAGHLYFFRNDGKM